MCPLDYYRPESLEEALALLGQGVPLAGGTRLTPERRDLAGVIDLQDIGLDTLDLMGSQLSLGATVTLQMLVDCEAAPPALQDAARREAGWNIRNAASLGGILHAADGRSHLLTTLAACEVVVQVMPGEETMSLGDYLDFRKGEQAHLVTGIEVNIPARLKVSYVARSPSDRPILITAAAWYRDTPDSVRLAMGGAGSRPSCAVVETVEQASGLATSVYAGAEDAWASAAYRQSAGGTLAVRLFEEVGP